MVSFPNHALYVSVVNLSALLTRGASVRPVTPAEKAFNRSLGARLRHQRGLAELTQEALADQVGLSRTSITNIERGNQPVSAFLLRRIATVLDCDVRDLLPEASDFGDTLQRLPADLPPKTADVVRRLEATTASA